MFEQVAYKPLVDRLTQGCTTDSAKAINVYNFVANNCNQPQGNENPKYDNTYDVLTHKTASCDQQVWLLMHLLQLEDIDARMVFLYGYDSISHHTVAEVNFNGHYVMLDPFYNLHVAENNNRMLSVEELTKMDLEEWPRFLGFENPQLVSYPCLYSKKYPYKIHSDNTLDRPRKMMRSLLRFNQCVFGVLFTKPFEALQD